MHTPQLPKRFYKQAAVVGSAPEGFSVTLDGRPLRTPDKALLAVPTHALAACVAAEWQNQGETLDLQRMTLTRLANVVIDRTPSTRDDLIAEFANYAETDVTCYLATTPAELRAQQEALWRPLREWAGQAHNIVLLPVDGVMANAQPQASLEAARAYAAALDDYRLTALVWACSLFGSCILALAVETGKLSADAAFLASCVDEDWQRAHWGDDEEALQARQQRASEADALGAWFAALGASAG